jgi:LysM repeat protein
VVGLGLVMRGHATLARYAAPAAFLLAATIAILLIRSGLSNGETAPATTGSVPATTVEEPAETTTAATTTAASGAEFYEIQPGDTLAVVAEEFDTTVEQLLVLNPDIDPVALTIGQRIRVK